MSLLGAGFGVLACCGMLAGAEIRENKFDFPLRDGHGQIEWINASSFRVCRAWGSQVCEGKPAGRPRVAVTRTDLGDRLRFATTWISLEVDKASLRIDVRGPEGDLLADVSEPRRTPEGIIVERSAGPQERYYGLGPRSAESADLAGQKIRTSTPFLISSAGYGEYFPTPGTYTYDLPRSRGGRRLVTAPGWRLEYFVYYGPSPKEILEQHAAAAGTLGEFRSGDFGILHRRQLPGQAAPLPAEASWDSLLAQVRLLVHGSLSGVLLPALDLSMYEAAGGPLFERARQLAGVVPVLFLSRPAARPEAYANVAEWRKRLGVYLMAYAQEARQFGCPLVRALAMQFPKDEQAARQTDEFMLGDELLVAPITAPNGSRSVYLPMGTWTDWRSGELHKGRQSVTVQAAPDEMPMFVRTGSILPLAPANHAEPIALHYYPRLPAEFFIFEEDHGDYSQFHAVPAGDVMRLEIESLRDRTYEWVLHHVRECREVAMSGRPYRKVAGPGELEAGTWLHDRSRNEVRIRCAARTSGDEILTVRMD